MILGKFTVPSEKMLIFYSSDNSAYNVYYKFPLYFSVVQTPFVQLFATGNMLYLSNSQSERILTVVSYQRLHPHHLG